MLRLILVAMLFMAIPASANVDPTHFVQKDRSCPSTWRLSLLAHRLYEERSSLYFELRAARDRISYLNKLIESPPALRRVESIEVSLRAAIGKIKVIEDLEEAREHSNRLRLLLSDTQKELDFLLHCAQRLR